MESRSLSDYLASFIIKEDKSCTLGEVSEDIYRALQEDRIHFIFKNNELIGFCTWLEIIKQEELFIFINNLYVHPTERTLTNLMPVRKFFREKFPQARMFYWHSRKHDRFFYVKGEK